MRFDYTCFNYKEEGHNPGGIRAHIRALRAFLFWYEDEFEPENWKNPIRKVKAQLNHKSHVLEEKCRAEEAIALVECIIAGKEEFELDGPMFGRKYTGLSLGVTMEVFRNWERNGLITVPRNCAGQRQYSRRELGCLKIIYILRQANFSMVSILCMLQELDKGNSDVRSSIDTPDVGEDIIRATDRYLSTLSEEEITVQKIIDQLMVISSQNH